MLTTSYVFLLPASIRVVLHDSQIKIILIYCVVRFGAAQFIHCLKSIYLLSL